MASKTTLNAKNLAALGAETLAALLIDISTGNAAMKRRLRLELAGAASPADAAREIRKRLATIARSRSYVEWDTVKALVNDLNTQRAAIVRQVAKADPGEALDLLWQFLALAGPVFERCDDSNGTVMEEFHGAVADMGAVAKAAKPDPKGLAERTFEALRENSYGQHDYLIETLAPALGPAGVKHLKALMVKLSKEPVPKPQKKDRVVIGWSSRGEIYADEMAERSRNSTVSLALEAIADAQGDVDAWIAQQTGKAKSVPSVAAEIAVRLLKAGRAEEAWAAINAVNEKRPGWIPFEWQEARLEVMEALGRNQDAQAFRWQCFERYLDADHLRAYLKRLPDFEDMEAEERALAFARAVPDFNVALDFLAEWPALDLAADLVTGRAADLDGNRYDILVPAATALEAKHPLAATLIRRSLIDFALVKARSSRYRHAARHLLECEGLAAEIEDFGEFETHEAYIAGLRSKHGRKSSFWSLLD